MDGKVDGQDGKVEVDGPGGGWGENYYDMENGSGPGTLPSWVETNKGENHFDADFFDGDIERKPGKPGAGEGFFF